MKNIEFIKTPFGQKIQVPEMYAGKITKKEQDAAGNLKFYYGETIIGRWSRLHGEQWENTLIGRMIMDRETGQVSVISVYDWDNHMKVSSVSGNYFDGYDLLSEEGNIEKSL